MALLAAGCSVDFERFLPKHSDIAPGSDPDSGMPDTTVGGGGGTGGSRGSRAGSSGSDPGCSAVDYYADLDGDGRGDSKVSMRACTQPAGYVLEAGDCDDTCPTCFIGGEEICDGKDNDCDGTPDERLTQSCGSMKGTCKSGMQTCGPEGWGACDGAVGGGQEVCEGKEDEDCDGSVDENCPCSGGSEPCGSEQGECGKQRGTRSCQGGMWGKCDGAKAPAAESCNGLDDDCNGQVDDLALRECGRSVGTCVAGMQACKDGQWGACDGERAAGIEVCDADKLDEDCDGQANEDCECAGGATQSCGKDIGICKPGTQTCVDGKWSAQCVGEVIAGSETCDAQNLDENCDGKANEGCSCSNGATTACGANTMGICKKGTQTCSNGAWGDCVGAVMPGSEVCDAARLDENCNGQANEGCACVNSTTQPCGRTGGACKQGTQTCVNGAWGACTGAIDPKPETCNTVDDNCDGRVDELTQTDPANCGACNNACAGDLACRSGACEQIIAQLSLGPQVSCARIGAAHGKWKAGDLACWGQNINNRLRTGADQDFDQPEPTLVPGVGSVRFVTQNQLRTCAVQLNADVVRCWGEGSQPEALGASAAVGDGDFGDQLGIAGVVSVATSDTATCGVSNTGVLSCYGESDANGSTTSSYLAGTVISSGVNSIAASGDIFCALMNSGTVQCWGKSSWISLTGATFAGSGVPQTVANSSGGTQLAGGGSGGFTFCVVQTGGTVACFGNNGTGQLGNGTVAGMTPWTVVHNVKGSTGNLSNIKQVSVAPDQTCALSNTGQVYCWGQQNFGELGLPVADADGMDSGGNGYYIYTLPRAVPNMADIVYIATEGFVTCGVRRSGRLVCMGYNTSGELGNGTKNSTTSPVDAHIP